MHDFWYIILSFHSAQAFSTKSAASCGEKGNTNERLVLLESVTL